MSEKCSLMQALVKYLWKMTTIYDHLLQDDKLKSESSVYNVKGGCTALVVLLLEGKMYIANAGDSR